jgi:SAM-dependent methyltransferase
MKDTNFNETVHWDERAQMGLLASGIDPKDRRGDKNYYIDLLQKMALEDVLELKGDEIVLDFGCGSGRVSSWIAPKVKKVVGLEITPEMIELAERNRTAENVEFIVYDGIHFPVLPYQVDLVISIGVLQYMDVNTLKRIVPKLSCYLKPGGKFCFIEQASDNPKILRPAVKDYLQAVEESKLDCIKFYPIRNGRWWILYLIRYGFIPRRLFPDIAKSEVSRRSRERKTISYYQDYLFVLKKS